MYQSHTLTALVVLLSASTASPVHKRVDNSIVALWDLGNSDPTNIGVKRSEVDDPTAAEFKVLSSNFAPGTLYGSIVKLGLTTTDDKHLMCTGYLLAADVVATAGHCAYEPENGRVTEISAFIGYHGRDSASETNVHERKGVRMATTPSWLDTGLSTHDVSVIKLDKPFIGVKPFKYNETPTTLSTLLYVVGYPSDKNLNGEPGAEMYWAANFADINLDTNCNHMLEYPISTAPGDSGSPLLTANGIVIGTHVNGGGCADVNTNSASPIGGRYGPDYNALIQAVNGGSDQFPQVSTVDAKPLDGVKYVRVS